MFLDSNQILYAGMIQIIRRGTAEIIEENKHGVFLKDTVSNAFMMATDYPENGIRWLKKHENQRYGLMTLFQKEVTDFADKRYEFTHRLECYQAVYTQSEPFINSKKLQIKVACEDELKAVYDHYTLLSEAELRGIIRRGELLIGYDGGKMVGFVGQHLEGSMGLLEILPEYRKNGFGKELEVTMINHMLTKGLIPFCQVEITNEASLRLQEKLGLTVSKERVYWLF